MALHYAPNILSTYIPKKKYLAKLPKPSSYLSA